MIHHNVFFYFCIPFLLSCLLLSKLYQFSTDSQHYSHHYIYIIHFENSTLLIIFLSLSPEIQSLFCIFVKQFSRCLLRLTRDNAQDTTGCCSSRREGAQRTAAIHFHLMSHKFVPCNRDRDR